MVVKANMGENWLLGLMILKNQLKQMFYVAIGLNGSNLSYGKVCMLDIISVPIYRHNKMTINFVF